MGLGSGPAWVLCFVRTCICYSLCVHSGTHIPVVFEVNLPAVGNSRSLLSIRVYPMKSHAINQR